MFEVPIDPRPSDGFADIVTERDLARYRRLVASVRDRLGGRRLWHVNSTPDGGGVAEILRSVLGYLRHDGIDVGWLVMDGDPGFFDITKRIHNRLHGELGDGGALGSLEAEHYARVTERNLAAITDRVRPGDVVVVHDPQPLGLIPGLAAFGATVIWTCHIGVDVANDLCRSAWDFLRPGLHGARAVTFTRRAYVWEGLDDVRVELIPPCIDAFSLKNIELDGATRDAILRASGVAGVLGDAGSATFARGDGSTGTVERAARIVETEPVPAGAPLVVQVSRWDALKDPFGVIEGFAGEDRLAGAHLMLAGPAPSSVADDPEAIEVLDRTQQVWESLGERARTRVHLANLPTEDVEENAIIVNALQRRADVVVQKSLAEGFGLTVTEAMWKRRPMVASRVGGIQDQIDDGAQGLLVDPRDLGAFGQAVARILADPGAAARYADAAHERVRERYLAPHYLAQYLELIAEVDRPD
ncbi:MAG TPA: glycosyltransferase [Actinomycetota bacterium]|nr:glycosyltransferase [Actinomycetota bacterium]